MKNTTRGNSRNSHSSRSGRAGGRGSRTHGFRLRSWWALLLGGVLVVIAYIAIFYHFFVSPLSFRWRAIYGEPDYPSGYQVMGIDVSHHQSRIDWDHLRNAHIANQPLQFVIIKATEGTSLTDENFIENFHLAKVNGIIRGAYHYYKPNRGAKLQAEYFKRNAPLEEGDLPPILDIEERGNKPLPAFQNDILTWLQIVEKHYGVTPIIYTGYKFKVDYLNKPAFDKYPLWIAHYYEKELRYKGPWVMWQYTDCGKVDGIRGTVDLNIFNGEMKDLVAFTIQPPSEPEE